MQRDAVTLTSTVRSVVFAVFTALLLSSAEGSNGQPKARFAAPYLGWSSWSLEATKYPGYGGMAWITADHIEQQSDALHKTLQRSGYRYINIDSGWMHSYDSGGCPIPNPDAFPGGIAGVAKHVHHNGQKLGLYWIPGINDDLYDLNPLIESTNAHIRDIVFSPKRLANGWRSGYKIDYSNLAGQKYIDSVVHKFRSWGIDMLKLDGVTPGSDITDLSIDARADVAAWGAALHRPGRPVWLTLSWHLDHRYIATWSQVANAVRIDDDVETYGPTLSAWRPVAERFTDILPFLGTIGKHKLWPDLDSLDVGCEEMDGLTRDERRSTMTLWAILCSPLYTGDDLTRLDAYGLKLLTNREVIEVNQHGLPARQISGGKSQIWAIRNEDGSVVLALFNLDDRKSAEMEVTWEQVGVSRGTHTVRDLWSHKNVGSDASGIHCVLAPHGCELFRLTVTHSESHEN